MSSMTVCSFPRYCCSALEDEVVTKFYLREKQSMPAACLSPLRFSEELHKGAQPLPQINRSRAVSESDSSCNRARLEQRSKCVGALLESDAFLAHPNCQPVMLVEANSCGLATFHNRDHLVCLRFPEVRVEELVTPVFGRFETEANAILMVFEKGVHRDLQWSDTWKFNPADASRFMPDRRPPARSFQDLLVWRKAHELVLRVYRLTAAFPKQETYGLTLQMRRAAVSVPANIAEGFRRRSKAEKARFLNIAEGSLEEVRYFLILAADLGYADTAQLITALEEVSRLLTAYSAAILTSSSPGS